MYYFAKSNSLVGYCAVSRGGTFRYRFSEPQDIIVGPYFIDPAFRGQQLSERMLMPILDLWKEQCGLAYRNIEKQNKVSASVGVRQSHEIKVTLIFRRLRIVPDQVDYYLISKHMCREGSLVYG